MSIADVHLALRARLETLVIVTTGSTTLAATATGYTRSAGSFLADGFLPGMMLTPAGFTSNPASVIIDVSATTITVRDARSAQSAASGRSLSVGLPRTLREANDGRAVPPNEPFVETELLGQAGQLLSFPAQRGTREELGLYLVRWCALPRTGPTALLRCTGAVLEHFPPGLSMSTDDGVVRVRGDVAPSAGGSILRDSGHVQQIVTIPWRRYVSNVLT